MLKTKIFASELQIEGLSELVIASAIPESVSVKLRGDSDAIASVSASDIIAYIDLSEYYEKGTYRVPIQIIKGGATLDIEPLEITVEPFDIKLQLDKTVSKNVRILPNIIGAPAPGYGLISGSVTPDQATIEGPSSLMDSIAFIETEPLDISGRYSDFSLLLALVRPGQFFTILSGLTVEYSAKISEADIEKEFTGIHVSAANLNGNFTAKIVPESGSVKLRGNYDSVERFVPNSDTLFVDCSGIATEGSYNLPVNVKLAPPLTETYYGPESVTVTIERR
ncbi:MAG: hypothetical protein LBH50_01605 [Spirochaetaceae bacterium]|jgi:YbbR domain-containing protein|nr:hypothetical protein [Spirochaetaceae bacterium]